MSDSHAPIFGAPTEGVAYTFRLAAYAVICSEAGEIALVINERGEYFLPGGGAFLGESPEENVRREVREELGYEVLITEEIGTATQYFIARDGAYKMSASFFRAVLTGDWLGEQEYELCRLRPEEAKRVLYHQCHAWSIEQVFRGE